jgi:enoyl-CoA hydratase
LPREPNAMHHEPGEVRGQVPALPSGWIPGRPAPAGIQSVGVRVGYDEDAIRIRIDRPPVNAFTVEMFRTLASIFERAAEDPRPVLLCGGDSIFSAGFDIKAPYSDPETVNAAARKCVAAVQQHPSPTVAAVEGAAVGLGLLIATSADILVVSRTARIRMPEVTLGITSDVHSLRRFLPEAWIRRLCMLGETFTAEELHFESAGASVCEPGTSEDRAEMVVTTMGDVNTATLRAIKQRLYE